MNAILKKNGIRDDKGAYHFNGEAIMIERKTARASFDNRCVLYVRFGNDAHASLFEEEIQE